MIDKIDKTDMFPVFDPTLWMDELILEWMRTYVFATALIGVTLSLSFCTFVLIQYLIAKEVLKNKPRVWERYQSYYIRRHFVSSPKIILHWVAILMPYVHLLFAL